LKSLQKPHISKQKLPLLSKCILKASKSFKTSIYLKIIQKNLEFFEKASILLKMSSKILVIFEKASDFLLKPP
jgi:hypothetical protein